MTPIPLRGKYSAGPCISGRSSNSLLGVSGTTDTTAGQPSRQRFAGLLAREFRAPAKSVLATFEQFEWAFVLVGVVAESSGYVVVALDP